MVRVSSKIRRVLIDAGLVSAEDWDGARERGGDIIDALLSGGSLDENALLEALGRSSNVPPVDLGKIQPDPQAIDRLPQETCQEFGIVPLSLNGKILTIAVSDPYDVLMFDDLRSRSGCQVRQVVSYPGAIRAKLEELFQTGARQVDDLLDQVTTEGGSIEVKTEEESEDLDLAAITAEGDESPAIKLANLILLRGLKEKASDIHIEPGEKLTTIRYRVDGRLKIAMTPPKGLHNALMSRLKILASLDIAERHKPQDGKFQIRYEGRSIDFRLSILPVVYGEKAVMRILDAGSMALKLDGMGYEEKVLGDINRAISASYGMMLVTGPTGSGKSTTLYSCVQAVADEAINVVTVEDPVEYRMNGVNQVPVNPKRGLTFAGALRSILRQDPDVVLVGEIRDTETADIAIKAALTGHLVLSTLHTNDAASTITRLIDMGVDPFMVSSSLLCVGAQRLARKLCDSCRIPLEASNEKLLEIGFQEDEVGSELFRANPDGCPRCNLGYRGRFAILETLFLEDSLKRMIVQGRSAQELKDEALRLGMVSLRRVGILNAIRGRTSLEEVMRVTMDD